MKIQVILKSKEIISRIPIRHNGDGSRRVRLSGGKIITVVKSSTPGVYLEQ